MISGKDSGPPQVVQALEDDSERKHSSLEDVESIRKLEMSLGAAVFGTDAGVRHGRTDQ